MKKTLWLIIGFEIIIGLLFYLLFRPTILFFSLLNIKVKPIIIITESLLINSTPQFLSSSILLFFLRLITIKYNTNIVHLLILTIILNIITEIIQINFIKYSTPDVWDIVFGIIGSVLSFLIITNLQSSEIKTQKSV
ncbi:MAG: hypothetical protein IT237_05895 [Bacteroidia bacterium]|nr:hypothetical protein [Bacteroidia bacterium]